MSSCEFGIVSAPPGVQRDAPKFISEGMEDVNCCLDYLVHSERRRRDKRGPFSITFLRRRRQRGIMLNIRNGSLFFLFTSIITEWGLLFFNKSNIISQDGTCVIHATKLLLSSPIAVLGSETRSAMQLISGFAVPYWLDWHRSM